MRVLFATTHIHLPQGTGGIEVTVDTLCKALAQRGFEAGVLCSLDKGGLFGLQRRLARKLAGSEAVEDRLCGYPVFRAWRMLQAAPEVIARFRPDVVVVQGWLANELAKPFLRAGLPTVISVHTAEPFGLDEELAAARRLSFVVNSRFTGSLHADKSILDVIPPLIVRQDYAVESSRAAALFVNPTKVKGRDIVFALARARPDVRFEVFETWRLAPEDRREAGARCAGLRNVHWRGAISDMRRAYRHAKLVLMPSLATESFVETWGRVASEGHISGIPTLASATGALPDTVGPAGICVAPDAPPDNWAEAFSALWDRPGVYAGYSDAAVRFSQREEIAVEQVVGRFLGVLERAAAQT
jgi:glycosyltransferase involved in cell wall biosynthesis